MATLRFLTAGESHGKGLVGILEGIPSGLSLPPAAIDRELIRRQQGYGRGGRMRIEKDHAEILSGVRWGITLGSPIALFIENRDWANWQGGMSPDPAHEASLEPVTRPRPGHADLSGAIKYGHKDVRNILERSSARETAMRVALGAIAKAFLSAFGIAIGSYVTQIGGIRMPDKTLKARGRKLFQKANASPVRCPDDETSGRIIRLIDEATKKGDSLGGTFEVVVTGLPVGLGSCMQGDRRLDARLARAMMSIQAIKGVEFGAGFRAAERFGSEVMDEIFYKKQSSSDRGSGFYRKTNNAGGIEGGMTTGMPVVVRAAMKPIPTLRRPLRSVDIVTKQTSRAAYERSDVCAVPAAAVIGEAVAALVIADAVLEKFGGDSMVETKRNFDSYLEYVKIF